MLGGGKGMNVGGLGVLRATVSASSPGCREWGAHRGTASRFCAGVVLLRYHIPAPLEVPHPRAPPKKTSHCRRIAGFCFSCET